MRVIATDIDGLMRINQLEEKLEWFRDKHRKALRHAQYCGDQWEYYEDRADSLAVIADALAAEMQGP